MTELSPIQTSSWEDENDSLNLPIPQPSSSRPQPTARSARSGKSGTSSFPADDGASDWVTIEVGSSNTGNNDSQLATPRLSEFDFEQRRKQIEYLENFSIGELQALIKMDVAELNKLLGSKDQQEWFPKDLILRRAAGFSIKKSFSVMRTFPILFGENPMKEGFKAYPGVGPYLEASSSCSSLSVERAPSEVRSLKGLRTISLLGIIMLFASLVQLDLVRKNRLKEVDIIATDKAMWMVISLFYLFVDCLLFFSAALQTIKCIRYLEQVDPNRQLSFSSGFSYHYIKIVFFKGLKMQPAIFLCLFGFQKIIFWMGDGAAWTQYDRLFTTCSSYWWTPIFFMNDIVPFYAKDLAGCMRWTALLSLEFKLFLTVPLFALAFHKGRIRLALYCAFSCFWIGLLVYAFILNVEKHTPGYLHMLDFNGFDLITLKGWTHIDSYASGIFLALLYQADGLGPGVRFLKKFKESSLTPYFVGCVCSFLMSLVVYFHMHIDENFRDEDSNSVVDVSYDQVFANAIFMTFAKGLFLFALFLVSLTLLLKLLRFTQAMLQSFVFGFLNRVSLTAFVVCPIIAKCYQASLQSTFTQNPAFPLYLSFFSIQMSILLASAMFSLFERPLRDLVKWVWVQLFYQAPVEVKKKTLGELSQKARRKHLYKK